ncbi:MAG: hypothetical protein QOF78_3423 [Phycisphaerales bacterium]|jgi:uncharacterized protein YuzE|nr:hypothetical protein [Phycisphaerales bacterium]MEA2735419.1 hypothetical protein [Humisphaera sp.]
MKRKAIKFEYDKDTDAAYLTIARGKVLESEEVEPGLIVDFGAGDQIVGVEILRFSRRFSQQPKSTKKLAG